MLLSSLPSKMPVPWASSALASFIRSISPTSQIGITDGQASYPDGFVPLNFTPVASGGVPPFGKDANGILNAVTQWLRWKQAGGPIAYDATFQATIGGYPQGARIESATTPGLIWRSTTDGNTSNPDTGGAGWSVIAMPDPNTAALRITATSGSTGANVRFEGNGATTPNKTLRVYNGQLQVMNSGYTAPALTLDDAGNITLGGGATVHGNATASGTVQGAYLNSTGAVQAASGIATAAGNITASTGRLLAGLGARGSGNSSAAAILSDFAWTGSPIPATGYLLIPGTPATIIVQWGVITTNTGGISSVFYPVAFPTNVLALTATIFGSNPGPSGAASVSVLPSDHTNFGLYSFTANSLQGPVSACWIAIGY